MPRMTENLGERPAPRQYRKNDAMINKRFAVLAFFDSCFYAIVFSVLLVSPVNAAPTKHKAEVANSIDTENTNIYAAHLSDELLTTCDSLSTNHCQLNVLPQKALLAILLSTDTNKNIVQAIENSEYEVLIGSALVTQTKENELSQSLVLEISTLWRGINLEETHYSAVLDLQETSVLKQATELIAEWIRDANSKTLFSAPFLYQFLGASDYQKELTVPDNIGDFALARQHLFNDPMQGMLSRYIHKEFDLAVFDVYVYPLKSNEPAELQSQSELLSEQNDIRLLSQAFGDDALSMTEIYELEPIQGAQDVRVFAFQATLKTNSDPLYATQYVYVKNDKVVKFSINVPARISDKLISNAITNIIVPSESSLMKQVRQTSDQIANAEARRVAP